jgi:hypothetical protein
MIKPTLPEINSKVSIFGVDAFVSSIEPENDWAWRVNLASRNALGGDEEWHIILPTDFRTEDGFPIEDGGNAFTFRDDCGLCGEDATLDDYAEFIGPDGERVMAHSSCAAEHNFTQS